MTVRGGSDTLGSTGFHPVVLWILRSTSGDDDVITARCFPDRADCSRPAGRIPAATGWKPVLPRIR